MTCAEAKVRGHWGGFRMTLATLCHVYNHGHLLQLLTLNVACDKSGT